MSRLILDVVYRHYNVKPHKSRFFATNNMGMPVNLFRVIGGFETTFTTSEDREFCDRSLYNGFQMIYARDALVYHAHLLKFRTFWRQHFNYGRGAFYFHRARAQRGQERIKVEPLPFYLNLLRYPFSQARGLQALLLAVLLVCHRWQMPLGSYGREDFKLRRLDRGFFDIRNLEPLKASSLLK